MGCVSSWCSKDATPQVDRASACSSTLSDAATIRYQLSGSDREDHVSRTQLVSEVRKIVVKRPIDETPAKVGSEPLPDTVTIDLTRKG